MSALTIVIFIGGLILLTGGAEALVYGSSRIATALRISPLITGLTIVALGTSAPEAAVSLASSFRGEAEIAFGNVVGSNLFNVLVILGTSALVTPLIVAKRLIRLEVPLMVFSAILMSVMALDGAIGWVDGVLLSTGLAGYTLYSIWIAKKESSSLAEEYEKEFGESASDSKISIWKNIALVLVGFIFLTLGSSWFVAGASEIARALGIREYIIGITIVAMGTSLPELATSIVAALRGERDIAVGNIVGSNLLNVFFVLGVSGLISPEGIPAPADALQLEVPFMLVASIICLPIFFTGYRISRWEGALLFGYYLSYITFLILNNIKHPLLPYFNLFMVAFVIPITTIVFLIISIRQILTIRKKSETFQAS